MELLRKRTVTVRVMEAFGVLIVLAAGLSIYVHGRLSDIDEKKARLDEIRVLTTEAKQLRLSVVNLRHSFAAASLARDHGIVDRKATPHYEQALDALKRIVLLEQRVDSGALGGIAVLESGLHRMHQSGGRMFEAYSRDRVQGNIAMAEHERISDPVIKAVDASIVNLDRVYAELSAAISQAIHGLVLTMLAMAGLIVFVGVTSALMLARRITRPMRIMRESIIRLVRGDLTHRTEIRDSSEFGELAAMIDELTDTLKDVVTGMIDGAANISIGSRQIARGIEDVSRHRAEKVSSLEQATASSEAIASALHRSADNAQQMGRLVKAALEEAEAGGNVLRDTAVAISDVDGSSGKITGFFRVVDDIASRANLLALKALVEAARAGEQDNDFAGVATEAHELAQRSAAAAREIRGLIDENLGRVKLGRQLVDQSGEMLDKVIANVRKVSGDTVEVSSSSREQSAGIERINQAVLQMGVMSERDAVLVGQAFAATRAMEEQSRRLLECVAFFKMHRVGRAAAAGNRAERPVAMPRYLQEEMMGVTAG